MKTEWIRVTLAAIGKNKHAFRTHRSDKFVEQLQLKCQIKYDRFT